MQRSLKNSLRSVPGVTRVFALWCLLLVAVSHVGAADFATHVSSFGQGPLAEVQALAVTPDGSVLVCDNEQVRKYPLDGEGPPEFIYSVRPAPPEVFAYHPISLVCGRDGDIYVGDYVWCTITHLDAEGSILHTVGKIGSGPGEFYGLTGLALGPDGTLYATDEGSNRIQHFAADLRLIGAWSAPVPDAPWDSFFGPEAVAVDSAGDVWVNWVWVGDGGEGIRILAYSPDGEPRSSFDINRSHWSLTQDMAFDCAGQLRLLLRGEGAVLILSPAGVEIGATAVPTGAQRFALLPDDSLVVGGSGDDVRMGFVEWLSPSGESLARWGEYRWGYLRHLLINPQGVGFDAQGNILVSGGTPLSLPPEMPYGWVYVDRYLPDGSLDAYLHYGENWSGMDYYFALTPEGDLLTCASPVVTDSEGSCYVLYDPGEEGRGSVILKYGPDGAFLFGREVGRGVVDLVMGQDGCLYLSRLIAWGDPVNYYRIERYDLNGNLLANTGWGGRLGAVDRGGHIYTYSILGDGSWEIYKGSSSGEFLGSMHYAGREAFTRISGMGLSEDGKLGVVTSEAGRVHIFQINPSRFSDIPWWYWAKEQIEGLAEAGVVAGYPDGTYHPAEVVTRGQLAVYLARALAGGEGNVPEGPGSVSFYDVPTTHWAYRHVEYCHAEGIVEGRFGRYYPEEVVDRGEMAVFLARALAGGDEAVPAPPAEPTFPDVGLVGGEAWLRKYVEYLAAEGVVSGYPDGRYHPEWVVTRDQMAVYVQRGFELPM